MNAWEIGAWIGWALLHSLWQGTLIAALVGSILLLLRNPFARHLVCVAGLVALPITTIATLVLTSESGHESLSSPAPSVPATPAIEILATSSRPIPEIDSARSEAADVPAQTFIPATLSTGATTPLWPTLAAAAWLIGVIGLSIRHATSCARLRKLRRSAGRPSDALRQIFHRLRRRLGLGDRPIELLTCEARFGPMLIGLFKPAVLLPMQVAAGLPAEELEAILAHELAHLARRDHWTNLVRLTAGTLYFYHPAVWWLDHCLQRERELAADDFVIRAGSPPKIYASALAHLADFETAGLAANSGSLLHRIERILRPQPAAPSLMAPFVPAALAVLAAIAVLLVTATGEETKIVEVKPGESIQAAVDRAPDGATVKIPAGTFAERIAITKSLALEGAGEDQTTISIEEPPSADLQKAARESQLRRAAAVTDEEKSAADLEFVKTVRQPAILVDGAAAVTLRGLTIKGNSTYGRSEGGTPSTLVYLFDTKALIENCTVAGPFGYGVMLAYGSDVRIEKTLVAGFWGTGVAVIGGERDDASPPSRLHMTESEVRNCYLRCITIGPGCDDTVIARCRISGSAWHGIRYDNASPTITGNAIYQNARSGIYASGKTHAAISGNLFWKNEMDGISCWFDNTDVIEQNTFVGNLREGMGALSSRPQVKQNIFADNPTAILAGLIAGQSLPVGDPVLDKNLFWNNKTAIQIGADGKPAPEGSLEENPDFVDPDARDFTLAKNSPARKAGVGVASPLSPVSPRPLLTGEKAIIPAGDTRSYQFWTAPGETKPSVAAAAENRAAAGAAAQWVADAFQLDDAAKRLAAIDQILAAVRSSDPGEVRTGLAAFRQIGAVEFSRDPFRPALRELLKSKDADLRAQACSALGSIGPNGEDLKLVIAMVDDPDSNVRLALPFAIKGLSGHGFTGKAGDAILKLLDDANGNASDSFWGAFWGTEISPELENRVVEASRKFDGYSDVFYYALTVHQSKREPTVTRLIELAANPDTVNVGQRVLWGLRQGLAEDQKPRVADLALKVLDSRSAGPMRDEAIECLKETGTSANLAALNALLAKPGVTGNFRKSLEEVRDTIKPRDG